MSKTDLLQAVEKYYTEKLSVHGPTPNGVDWKDDASQHLRFDQLLKLLPSDLNPEATLLDFGCGYGALREYLTEQGKTVRFTGYDIAPAMIDAARARYGEKDSWISILPSDTHFDYVIASGILNVKMAYTEEAWLRYILETIETLNKTSRKGFAFNILTNRSDREKWREHLYYADPTFLFDYCVKNFSRHVTLLHDYPLYEFTMIIRKCA